ncbi:MAG: helix-turn-helix domain-containing protein [Thermomicrobium sp.]|nr:helix-turn-helix domain-containing protein [Thermomicrobium sp.]
MELLKIREAAERLRISESTLRRLMALGLVRPVRLGRSVRVPLGELEALVRRLQEGEGEDAGTVRS